MIELVLCHLLCEFIYVSLGLHDNYVMECFYQIEGSNRLTIYVTSNETKCPLVDHVTQDFARGDAWLLLCQSYCLQCNCINQNTAMFQIYATIAFNNSSLTISLMYLTVFLPIGNQKGVHCSKKCKAVSHFKLSQMHLIWRI